MKPPSPLGSNPLARSDLTGDAFDGIETFPSCTYHQ
jgi:hypothetical protein